MKAALHGFTLNFPDDRKLKLPVESNTVTIDGQERTLVMIQVKRPARRKVLLRPRKQGAAATSTPAPAAALAAGKQPEAEARQPTSGSGGAEKQG